MYSFESQSSPNGDLIRNLEENTRDGHRLQLPANEERNTIDDAAAHERGSVFLKLELDDNEAETLATAGKILERQDTRVIIRVTSKVAEQECMWILDEFGFDISIIGPAWWRAIVKDRSSESPQRWIVAEKAEFEGLFS